jgi:hypothetical protein
MRYFANHMLMMTVPMVRVSHTGMKTSCMFRVKREGKKERAANPTMIIVRSMSLRGEDFPEAPGT